MDGLRQAIGGSALPGGLRAHLAGPVAAGIDTSRASHSSGNLGEDLSIVFILVLLLMVFRAVLAPLLTLAPAVLVTQLAGPVIAEAAMAGLRVSSLTQILILILALGAGTDYGLFLVFRVREELRAGQPPHDAVVRALSRVGESVAFSAATVIAALLTLLLATFGLFSGLGVPLAIAVGLMLAAALTLLPALLAIFGRAAFWPSRTAGAAGADGVSAGRPGWWGRIASRIVARPAAVLALGLAVFGGLAVAAVGYTPTGFGAGPAAPSGSDSAAGGALLAAHFPAASSNPTPVLVRFPAPVWADPGPAAAAERRLAAVPQFAHLGGPLSVNGVTLAPGQLAALHSRLGDPRSLPALPPPGAGVDARTWAAYRAESQFVSPDGRTVRFAASLAAGDPDSDAALRQVPVIRAAVAAAARASGATAWGVAGDAAVTYDVSRVSGQDLLRIVPVAIIVIGLLLALVLRSAVAPVYLIASVVLSYLAALGVAVLIFQGTGPAAGCRTSCRSSCSCSCWPWARTTTSWSWPGSGRRPRGCPCGRRSPRRWPDRFHGQLGRAGAGRHVRGVRGGGQPAAGRRPVPGRARLAGHRHPDGRLPGPHPAGAVGGGAARPVELVAVPGRRSAQPWPHRGQRR